MKSILPALLVCCCCLVAEAESVWQWSTPIGEGRAFLWIPERCRQVRAVVIGQDNMIEQGILEHPAMRAELSELGIAEIFIAPPYDTFQDATNNDAATFELNSMLKSLADESGYSELPLAPIVPLGHSAMASYPWDFAAWNPSRTLAILSVHGDAPQTKLTGNGHPNLEWGERNIDGIPGLMVMGEYEWLEPRLTPALEFRAEHPLTPLGMLAEPGSGHFNYSDRLVKFLAMFIRKSAEQRLPLKIPLDQPPVLRAVNPTNGWLVERWQVNKGRTVLPAPFAEYTGDPSQAFWAFDKEMAWATQNYSAGQTGKLPQLLGFIQDGQIVPQTETHQQVNLKFEPLADGVTFHLSATFLETVDPGSANASRWTGLPPRSPIGHATGGGPIVISRISGPVEQIDANTFRLRFDRIYSTTDRRNFDVWLLASQPGDAKYKSAFQQAWLKLPLFSEGAEQQITFPKIPDQKAGIKSLKLDARSNSGRPVYFYVREGPATMDGDTLQFTRIPPRTKFPVTVTVVAWQYGSGKLNLKTAVPVEQTFQLIK